VSDSNPSAVPEEFIQLFTRHQRRLYLLILSQVPNTTDAEEILQDANCVMLAKYGQFELGTNFFSWAARIITFEVLKYRQRYSRSKVRFTDQFLDVVASEAELASDDLEQRRAALDACLKKLRDKDRELIQSRYQPDLSAKEMAEQIGRPANSVYQSLGRIRRVLMECITRQLSELDPPPHPAS